MNWRRNRILRQLRARPRLFIAAAVAAVVGAWLPVDLASHAVTRWLIAWNVGTLLYVLLAAVMMWRSQHDHMRQRALQQDDGQIVILALVVVTTVASLAAIAGQLALARDMHGTIRTAHIALAGVTVLSSWAFIQVMFTLHYAHDFYAAAANGRPGRAAVPRRRTPRLRRLLLLRGRHRHLGPDRRCVVHQQADAPHRHPALHPGLPVQHHGAGLADQYRRQPVVSAGTRPTGPPR